MLWLECLILMEREYMEQRKQEMRRQMAKSKPMARVIQIAKPEEEN